MERKLGGGDDAEAFGEVEVVYRMSTEITDLNYHRIHMLEDYEKTGEGGNRRSTYHHQYL